MDEAQFERPNRPKNCGTAGDSKANKATVFIAEVRKDEPLVTERELWSYYLYYNGDNGSGPYIYTRTLFQNIATAAGYDPVSGPGSSCLADTASGQCVLPWMGGIKSVSSIILIANGVSFAIMTVLFTSLSSACDYGTFGRWLLFVVTTICWASQYACLSLTSPDRWKLAMVLYIIGYVTFGATMSFYAAVFPRLARNTPRTCKLRGKYEDGEISLEEYELEESMEKNRISNISLAHNTVGWVVTFALNLALLTAPKTANDPKVQTYTVAMDNSYWVLLGVWWFIFQLPRPGPPLPKGEHYLTVGWKQVWEALKTYKQLPYTFVYLIALFLLADGFNTTVTLIAICQNDKFHFSFLEQTYLGLTAGITSIIGALGLWYIQRHWKISTKKMFSINIIMMALLPLWGMIGIWTDKFGFHNAWEFWAYNVVIGLFQIPYSSYSQTMMAELSPPGFDNMFFGLFGLSSHASSLIGSYVIQAIIDKTNNNWQGFPFLFAMCTSASLVIWFGVDVTKGRRDAVRWAMAQRGG
ncbi:MFS general substrate transporter [Melanogaster broomeanus]|nr:MFS general substrate transporter [Melanogaster broomeanus]